MKQREKCIIQQVEQLDQIKDIAGLPRYHSTGPDLKPSGMGNEPAEVAYLKYYDRDIVGFVNMGGTLSEDTVYSLGVSKYLCDEPFDYLIFASKKDVSDPLSIDDSQVKLARLENILAYQRIDKK
ncbi:MAG: hypothetical protein ACQESG_03485 [Nanobdellota archaeon]